MELVKAAAVGGGLIAAALLWNGLQEREEARARLNTELAERRCDRLVQAIPADYRQAIALGGRMTETFWNAIAGFEGFAGTGVLNCGGGNSSRGLTLEQSEMWIAAYQARDRQNDSYMESRTPRR